VFRNPRLWIFTLIDIFEFNPKIFLWVDVILNILVFMLV